MKTSHWVLAILFVFLPATGVSSAFNGSIGIFSDQNANECHRTLPGVGVPLKLYVFGQLSGSSRDGIRGAEYSIVSHFPTDWVYAEDFSPATDSGAIIVGAGAISGGQPGVNIAWGECQPGVFNWYSGQLLLLQCLTVLDVTGTYAYDFLRVEAHSTPGNPYFRCPLFNLCDDPVFTKVCVGYYESLEFCPFPPGALACHTSVGGVFEFAEGPCGAACYCVATEDQSWSSVKELYR